MKMSMKPVWFVPVLLVLTSGLSAKADPVLPAAFQEFTYIESSVEVNGSKLHRVLESQMFFDKPGALITQAPDGKNVFTYLSFGLKVGGSYAILVQEQEEHFPGFYFPVRSQQLEGTWSAPDDGSKIMLDFFGELTAVKAADGTASAQFVITRDLLTPGLAGKSVVLTPILSDVKF